MVGSGVGVSVLPRLAAVGYPVVIPLVDPDASRELAVVWRDSGELAPAPRAFLDLLVTAAGERSGAR
jgi:DNA-binding transcriptional LysR family regulator